ncbi:hypothetical protein PM082_015311 [Marasmius tenuissimus]|nr:hypothetical protein PM082_015311 [Marasmius tenuissimus]
MVEILSQLFEAAEQAQRPAGLTTVDQGTLKATLFAVWQVFASWAAVKHPHKWPEYFAEPFHLAVYPPNSQPGFPPAKPTTSPSTSSSESSWITWAARTSRYAHLSQSRPLY